MGICGSGEWPGGGGGNGPNLGQQGRGTGGVKPRVATPLCSMSWVTWMRENPALQ